MNISFVCPELDLFGGNKRAVELAKRFMQSNYLVRIYTPMGNIPIWARKESLLIRSYEWLLKTENDFEFYLNPTITPIRYFIESKAKNKILYILNNDGKYRKEYQKWIDKFKDEPNFFIAGNNGSWRKNYNTYDVPYFDLIGGIDPKQYFPVKVSKNPGFFNIVIQGRVSRAWKGTLEIISALEELEEWKKINLIIFNDRPLNLKSKLRIEQKINVPQNKMREVYSQGNLFIHYEDNTAGWSNTCAEALACKLPIVTTRFGTTDFAIHNQTAYIIERNRDNLKKAVKVMMHDPELREQLAEAGHEAIKPFSWNNLAAKVMDMFATLYQFHKLNSMYLDSLATLDLSIVEDRTMHIFGEKEIECKKNEAIVLCLVKNGELYIREFIEHYLSKGFKHIIFLDNGSSDNTIPIAKNYPNVSIYQTDMEFKKYKHDLRRYLIQKFAKKKWSLYVDIDEFFDFPFSDKLELEALLDYMNQKNYTSVTCQMLDLFPDARLSDIMQKKHDDFRKSHTYYDTDKITKEDYYGEYFNEYFKLHKDLLKERITNVISNPAIKEHSGGIRKKIFKIAPLLTKQPLVFFDENISPQQTSHHIRNARIADISCVLHHYKFLSDFRTKTMEARHFGSYANNSEEYRRYHDILEKNANIKLKQPNSKKLKDIDQLIREGFLVVSDEYKKFAETAGKKKTTKKLEKTTGQKKKMKVAFIIHKFPRLHNTFILYEIIELIKRGYDISIFSIFRPEEDVRNRDIDKYNLMEKTYYFDDFIEIKPENLKKYEKYRAGFKQRVHSFESVAEKISMEKFDIIHAAFANKPATAARILSSLTGMPFTFEAYEFDLFADFNFAKEKIDLCRKIFIISDYNKRYLIDVLNCPPEKIIVKRILFNEEYCSKLIPKKKYKNLIISVCRLEELKGIEYGIEAVSRLVSKFPKLKYIVIGDGNLRKQLENKVKELNLEKNIKFLGKVEPHKTLEYINRATLFLLPSIIADNGDRDGIPAVLVEAMYLKTPCISSNISGIPELIENNISGFLTEPKDVDDISKKIEDVLSNKTLRLKMGNIAKEKVGKEFTVKKNMDILDAAFEDIKKNALSKNPYLNNNPTNPKILLLADYNNWAYHYKALNIAKHLSKKYDFDIKYTNEIRENHDSFRHEDYDAIYIFYWRDSLLKSWKIPRYKLGSGQTVELKFYEPPYNSDKPLKRDEIKELLSQFKVFSANSLRILNEMKKYRKDIIYAPNGVDTEFFKPINTSKNRVFTVGWVGNKSVKLKHFDDIIMPAIKKCRDVKLIVASKEKYVPRERMPEFYNRCDCLIIASEMDGTPNPGLEAAACGKTIISNIIGNMPELITDGENGFLVELDIEEYARKICYLRDNREICKQMGLKLREEIEKNWSWKKQVENYDVIFQKLLEK